MRAPKFMGSSRGSFLLEAMLAVFLTSVALVAMIRGLMMALKASEDVRAYSAAVLEGEKALIEMLRLNGQASAGVVKIIENEDRLTKVVVSDAASSSFPRILKSVDIEVSWAVKNKSQKLSAASMIMGPVEPE